MGLEHRADSLRMGEAMPSLLGPSHCAQNSPNSCVPSTAADTVLELGDHSAVASPASGACQEVRHTTTRLSVVRLQAHRLPAFTLWAVMVLTAMGVAVTNMGIICGIWLLTNLKLRWTHEAMLVSVPLGAFTIVSVSTILAVMAAVLVTVGAPGCAGGGLPELKGYLNGSKIPGLFSGRAFVVRFLGLVAACSSGLPIGREGPSIVLGGHIGHGIMQAFALPHARHWLDINLSGTGQLPVQLVDEERLAYAKRIGCALGGAAGMATIFNAPIGGLLYMLEEITISSWAPELTLRAFVCTALACLANKGILNLTGHRIGSVVIFAHETDKAELWQWMDIPFLILFAVVLGTCSGLYIRAVGAVWSCRGRLWTQGLLLRVRPWGKIVEVAMYTVLCTSVFVVVAITVGSCTAGHEDRLRFNCPEGESSFVATMLLGGAEENIKHLYSRAVVLICPPLELLATLIAYSVLNIGLMGIAIPMGSFIPNMVIGALTGRLLGHVLLTWRHTAHLALASPGIYSLMGSAALLGGSLRQSLSIVVFLMECIGDIDVIVPLMVTIFVAHYAAKFVSERGLDEELMLRKGISYLEDELPKAMDNADIVAKDLCAQIPKRAWLAPRATASEAKVALMESDCGTFPVVQGGACIGLVTRKRLATALKARSSSLLGTDVRHTLGGLADEDDDAHNEEYMSNMVRQGSPGPASAAGLSSDPAAGLPPMDDWLLPIHKFMDASPYLLLENTPAARLQPLFSRLSLKSACVVSASGAFVGVLTRASLIEATHHYEENLPLPCIGSHVVHRSDGASDGGGHGGGVGGGNVGGEAGQTVIATPVVEVDDLEIGRLATLASVAERPPPPPPPPTWSIHEEASGSGLSQVGPDRRRISCCSKLHFAMLM